MAVLHSAVLVPADEAVAGVFEGEVARDWDVHLEFELGVVEEDGGVLAADEVGGVVLTDGDYLLVVGHLFGFGLGENVVVD